jgi:PIN domain nuclease of toxin-antitoxin system
LWWRAADPRLPSDLIAAVASASVVYVSAASAWEIGLKAALGKLRIPEPVEEGVRQSGFSELPVTFVHARVASELPMHHRDPFDRMLVAQALEEGLCIATHDAALRPYGVPHLLVP